MYIQSQLLIINRIGIHLCMLILQYIPSPQLPCAQHRKSRRHRYPQWDGRSIALYIYRYIRIPAVNPEV